MGQETEWLSTGEAAKRLGLSPRTIRDWCDADRIASWKTPSGRRKISADTIQALLDDRETAR